MKQAATQGNTNAPQANSSNVTKGMKERAELAKSYIESKYNKRRCEESERRNAWEMLEHKMSCLNLSDKEKDLIK
jgi:hypothetical protein